jgi:hypothetical protein
MQGFEVRIEERICVEGVVILIKLFGSKLAPALFHERIILEFSQE